MLEYNYITEKKFLICIKGLQFDTAIVADEANHCRPTITLA